MVRRSQISISNTALSQIFSNSSE